MTKLLEEAIKRVRGLPDEDQDAIAALMIEQLESEAKWAELFADPRSERALEQLAEEALQEFREGKALPLDPDDL